MIKGFQNTKENLEIIERFTNVKWRAGQKPTEFYNENRDVVHLEEDCGGRLHLVTDGLDIVKEVVSIKDFIDFYRLAPMTPYKDWELQSKILSNTTDILWQTKNKPLGCHVSGTHLTVVNHGLLNVQRITEHKQRKEVDFLEFLEYILLENKQPNKFKVGDEVWVKGVIVDDKDGDGEYQVNLGWDHAYVVEGNMKEVL